MIWLDLVCFGLILQHIIQILPATATQAIVTLLNLTLEEYPTLACRFDLLWLILDKSDEELDQQLARHVLRIHSRAGASRREQTIDTAALVSAEDHPEAA